MAENSSYSSTRSHVFHGQSRIRKVATVNAYGMNSIFSMELSPDGKFLAIGNDDGALEIKALVGNNWTRASVYLTGAAVRTIVWHPTEHATLFSGSANGNIYKIAVKPSEAC
ncbi:hypothetical protein JR316_0006190 [Psilocybe cubensis]|uniref:Uncharacterized protein n=2 Tax=Psilocybe cubensis TaxID=181762 RepID=A0ACB8H1K8_PSICU|nr:hypothetical protein JR316_0006190 [Psilocybe cubensis]KAH9481663.1 hypothetical protein JR316_0006190 [Psilocybe cubensis]